MSSITTTLLFALLATLIAFTLVFTFVYSRLKRAHDDLQAKLVATHARQSEPIDKKKKALESRIASKVKSPIDGSTEILELRRDNAKMRDEIQKLKADVRDKTRKLSEVDEVVEKQLYQLREENKNLLQTLQEQDRQLAGKSAESDPVKEIRLALEEARQKITVLQRQMDDTERQRQTIDHSRDDLRKQLSDAQTEVRRWRETSALANGKPLTPAVFVRWRHRAIVGRDMYRMMKQLRELSDHKLSLYQDSIIRLCSHTLDSIGAPYPVVQPGDVVADRFLGETLAILNKDREANETPPPPSSQNIDTLVENPA